MRIARYLYHNTSAPIFDMRPEDFPTVEGEHIGQDTAIHAATATEEAFEEAICGLYTDHRYHRRMRWLMRRSWLLDRLLGPMDERIYRYSRHGDDTAAQKRRQYRSYMATKLQYDRQGQRQRLTSTRYNDLRLEEMLPEAQWRDLQLLKHGPDHAARPVYDEVVYHHPPELPGVKNPPPHVAEWLLSVIRGGTFERREVG